MNSGWIGGLIPVMSGSAQLHPAGYLKAPEFHDVHKDNRNESLSTLN